MKLINGGIYQNGYRTFALISAYPKWGMLHIERHVNAGMSAPMFQHDKNGQFLFTESELVEDWDAASWILLDGRLRIQKIDDLTFVEYSDGDLEPYKLNTEVLIYDEPSGSTKNWGSTGACDPNHP